MAGRPSPIDRTIEVDGEPMTVADAIVLRLRAGNYIETAAASVGIVRQTVYEWLHVAASARHAEQHGKTPTAHQRRCMAFSDAVAEAEARWETGANVTLERLARGGAERTIVTIKVDAAGNQIEKTTRTETLLPNPQVIQWRLTRKHPTRYGDQIAVTGAGGGPLELSVEDRAAALAELVRKVKEVGPAARESKPATTTKGKTSTRAQPGKGARRSRAGNDPQDEA